MNVLLSQDVLGGLGPGERVGAGVPAVTRPSSYR
jgi:hypothetical protein